MCLGDLWFPGQLGLPEDLSRWLEILSAVEQDGADNDRVRAHDLLVVVGVGCAVWAVVAVDCLACSSVSACVLMQDLASKKTGGKESRLTGVTVIGVCVELSFGNLQV